MSILDHVGGISQDIWQQRSTFGPQLPRMLNELVTSHISRKSALNPGVDLGRIDSRVDTTSKVLIFSRLDVELHGSGARYVHLCKDLCQK